MKKLLYIDQLEKILILVKKYKDNTATDEELADLHSWLSADKGNPAIFDRLLDDDQIGKDLLAFEQMPLEKHIRNITKRTRPVKIVYYRSLAAAAIAAIVILGVFIYRYTPPSKHPAISGKKPANRTLPRNGAVLTLADGSKMVLDSMHSGNIATQGNVKIVMRGGQMVYVNTQTGIPVPGENTLTTPNGRRFQLTLPDNSKVWLNAASSIKYPVLFTGSQRTVEIKGEAYFEVAEDTHMPFVVEIDNSARVQVLGTHFNINAYDKLIKTTLLQGSVRFSSMLPAKTAVKLNPGQQGQLQEGQDIKVSDEEDPDEVMAWRNNRFIFNSAGIESIMNAIHRWYDIKIVYSDNIPDKYTINVSNELSLPQLLKFIEKSGGVHFEMEGDTVIVKKV